MPISGPAIQCQTLKGSASRSPGRRKGARPSGSHSGCFLHLSRPGAAQSTREARGCGASRRGAGASGLTGRSPTPRRRLGSADQTRGPDREAPAASPASARARHIPGIPAPHWLGGGAAQGLGVPPPPRPQAAKRRAGRAAGPLPWAAAALLSPWSPDPPAPPGQTRRPRAALPSAPP